MLVRVSINNRLLEITQPKLTHTIRLLKEEVLIVGSKKIKCKRIVLMKIKHLTKDPNWIKRVEEIGYGFHTDHENPYWIDHYYYSISDQFADKIYHATAELWQMCLKAVEYVIENKQYHLFHIPAYIHHHIEKSWEEDAPSIYGRFDFAYDATKDQLKMLEFNADTPTSLFE